MFFNRKLRSLLNKTLRVERTASEWKKALCAPAAGGESCEQDSFLYHRIKVSKASSGIMKPLLNRHLNPITKKIQKVKKVLAFLENFVYTLKCCGMIAMKREVAA